MDGEQRVRSFPESRYREWREQSWLNIGEVFFHPEHIDDPKGPKGLIIEICAVNAYSFVPKTLHFVGAELLLQISPSATRWTPGRIVFLDRPSHNGQKGLVFRFRFEPIEPAAIDTIRFLPDMTTSNAVRLDLLFPGESGPLDIPNRFGPVSSAKKRKRTRAPKVGTGASS